MGAGLRSCMRIRSVRAFFQLARWSAPGWAGARGRWPAPPTAACPPRPPKPVRGRTGGIPCPAQVVTSTAVTVSRTASSAAPRRTPRDCRARKESRPAFRPDVTCRDQPCSLRRLRVTGVPQHAPRHQGTTRTWALYCARPRV